MTSTDDKEKRIDFTDKVKFQMAQRVNHQCSIPRCTNPASAPNLFDGNQSVNMGTACHIYAAKSTGPRGQADKSPKYIGSVENGIWCCNYHGSRIDKCRGKEFTPDTLYMWKTLAEARVSRLSSGYNYPYGYIDSIEILKSEIPSIYQQKLPKVNLTAHNILHSLQNTGQSTLLEFISCVSRDKFLNRWQQASSSITLHAKIAYSTLDNNIDYRIQLEKTKLQRLSNHTLQYTPPNDIEIIYIDLFKSNPDNIIKHILDFLNIDLSTLDLILENLNKNPQNTLFPATYSRIIQQVDDENNEEAVINKIDNDGEPCFTLNLNFSRDEETLNLPYEAFSTTEKIRILLSIIFSKAILSAKDKPTLLIIASRGFGLDLVYLTKMLNILRRLGCQNILEAPWKYAKIFDSKITNTTLPDLDSILYQSPEEVQNFYNELEFWSVKDIFSDSN